MQVQDDIFSVSRGVDGERKGNMMDSEFVFYFCTLAWVGGVIRCRGSVGVE